MFLLCIAASEAAGLQPWQPPPAPKNDGKPSERSIRILPRHLHRTPPIRCWRYGSNSTERGSDPTYRRGFWTAAEVGAVGAMFKAGMYRSFPNYVSAARGSHIDLEYKWTEALDRAVRKATRCVTRGIGPSRQNATLDIERIHAKQYDSRPIVDGGPMSPGRLAVHT